MKTGSSPTEAARPFKPRSRILQLLMAAGFLMMAACCPPLKKADALKTRTLNIMEHARTESYVLNQQEAEAVQSEIGGTADLLQGNPLASACRGQWQALSDSTGSFFKLWKTKDTPLAPAYVDHSKKFVGKSFDAILNR